MSGRKRQPFFAHFAGDKSSDWYEGTERNQSLHGHRNTLRSGVDLSGTIHDLDDSHALLIGDGQMGAPRGECSEVVRRSSATMAAPMARSHSRTVMSSPAEASSGRPSSDDWAVARHLPLSRPRASYRCMSVVSRRARCVPATGAPPQACGRCRMWSIRWEPRALRTG
jgi:hypothetical protein